MIEGKLHPIVQTAGRFTIARFERAAVVLDVESQSLYELCHDAARAFDVLCDLHPALPSSVADAERLRRVLRVLRREILGESLLGPHESLAVDGADGELLFRRYPEPGQWRRSETACGWGVEIAGALVRLPAGALLVYGAARATSAFARAFRRAGVDAIGWDSISIECSDVPTMRSRAWSENLPAVETWAVEMTREHGLRVSRLSSENALVRLLFMARLRPSAAALKVLASCAEAVRHFSVVGPSDTDRVAVAIETYHGFP